MKSEKKKVISLNLAILIFVLVALAGGIAAYILNEQKKEYITQSQAAVAAQEQYITAAFEKIESNLARIRQKENMIQQNFTEPENYSGLSTEERIQHEIDFIDYLIEENNSLIASLNEQLKDKDGRLGQYERTVKDLKSKISTYQAEVDLLVVQKNELQRSLDEVILEKNNLVARVDTLGRTITERNGVIRNQEKMIAARDSTMSIAYYVVDTYKSLRDKNVLTKEGGVLGINRVKELVSDPDEKQFKKIDTREVTQIPIDAKRWEIVTGQDPASYDVQYRDDLAQSISITNPEKFWGKSKYLVIVVRESENSELAESR